MRASFTLLHGTWAPHAAWTDDGSKLCVGLRKRFGDSTAIHRVNWGGWNRVGTRARGADQLATHLRGLNLSHDERHFVIAHSHGGNVALYSLKHADAAAKVSGVATLATPFLVAGKRRWSDRLGSSQLALLTPIVFLILGLAGWVADKLQGGWLGWLVFFLMSTLLFVGLWLAVRGWGHFVARVAHLMEFGPIAPERLLILRSPGDEASVLLLTSRAMLAVGLVIIRVLTQLCSRVEAVLERSRRQPGWGWAVGLAVVATWLALVWLTGFAIEAKSWWATPLLWLVLAVSLWIIFPIVGNAVSEDQMPVMLTWHWLLALALLLAAILPSLLLVFFGWQLAVANLAIDVTAESTPTGEWSVVTLPASLAVGDSAAAVMTHSALYEDDQAIQRICEWVDKTMATQS